MNTDSPLVSVIIPCYNVSSYVEKAIYSILSQSYKNLEVWVVDDASSDDTLKKIKAIKDDRIKVVIFKENTQKVGAVNAVLKNVTGHFIAFQDADDWAEPSKIKEQLREFEKDKELGICFTNYAYSGSKTFQSGKICLSDSELKNEFLNFTYERSAGTSPTMCGTMMIPKEVLNRTGGYNPYFAGRVAEDVQWIYRILKDFKGVTIAKKLYNCSLREGSFTDKQSRGIVPKYAYSWQLLSKIIYKDIHDGIDVLAPENKELLKKLELEACEDALVENIKLLTNTINVYKNSMNFKVGKLLLSPFRILDKLKAN